MKHHFQKGAGATLRRASWLLVFSCFGLSVSADTARSQLRPDRYTGVVSELNLRKRAIKRELPPFPEDAIRAHETGVAVAAIEVDTSGRVFEVTVLEAPARSIEESVAKTLMAWRFEPFVLPSTGQRDRVRGKLTFYFVIEGGIPKVYGADDAPYLGRWPEKPGGNAMLVSPRIQADAAEFPSFRMLDPQGDKTT
jgi:TonB family protein